MDFLFFNAANQPLFTRNDAEQAEWTVEQFSFFGLFPFDSEKVIERGQRIAFRDADGVWQAFEIRNCKIYEPDHYQEITAEHICVSELTDDHVSPKEWDNVPVGTALASILGGTLWSLGNVTATEISSGSASYGSAWQGVNTIISNWNVYITPRITIGPSGITGRYLDVAPAQGNWRGLRLSINSNIEQAGVTYDDTNLLTAMYGYGKTSTPEQPITPTSPEPQDLDPVTLTFATVTWTETVDHPAKPAGQTYLENPTAKALYGRNGRNRFGFYQNGDVTSPEKLLELTWTALKKDSEPIISIEGTLHDLKRLGYAGQTIRLHDTAIVEILPAGVEVQREITTLTVDLLNPLSTVATIGAYIPNIIYINKETAEKAESGSKGRGGGGGGGRGQTDAEKEFSEFQTQISANQYQILLRAWQQNINNEILRQAGIQLDANGVLIYSQDNENMIGSKIQVEADRIESSVYASQSQVYSAISQTASSIYIAVGNRPTTVVQNSHTSGTPTSINGRGLKENDIWIDTADQDSWDAALNYNWNDDLDYSWNDLRSDKIYVYHNGAWQLAIDGTILAEDTDLQVERDRIALLARNIDTLDGYARENFAQVNVRANEIYSEVLDKTNNLGSSITQTATQIRSEVHAANSQIYSEIIQTASNILLHVENAVSDLGATLEVTASQIRSDVYATQSSVYSSIVQTASQIRSEVASTTSSLRSSIKQNADSIELKVSKGDISSTINQTAQSVLISASRINLEGYVTADELSAVSGDFEKLTAGTTTATALKAALLETTGNLNVKGTNYSGVTLKIGSVVSATVLSSSSAAMDFDHYHSISISESGGVITVKTGKASSSEGSANFNIADTAFYINAMSAQWAAARAKVEMPSQGTDTTFTVKVPSATEGEQETKTFTIQKGATPASSGYASVALSGTVVGRIDIGDWYTAGQTDAHAEYTYHTGYLRGSSVSVTPVGTASVTIKRYGNAELYKKDGSNYTSVGSHNWYYVDYSSGTQYFSKGADATYYTSGGFLSYYTKNVS